MSSSFDPHQSSGARGRARPRAATVLISLSSQQPQCFKLTACNSTGLVPRARSLADCGFRLFQINLSVYNKPMIKKVKEYIDYYK